MELARYTISTGKPVVCGQRISGVVRVTDRPREPPGRSYLLERGLEQGGNAALQALVATTCYADVGIADTMPTRFLCRSWTEKSCTCLGPEVLMSAYSERFEECQERVGRLVAARFDVRGCGSRERLFLDREVGVE